MSDVSINIVSQFLGQKAFDKAGNSANKLANSVKKALIGVGFEEFARRSINAFAANEKEMAGLANTLKNLGLQMQNASVASYLDKLALATGALKSDLVPAFQTLATTTKDVADATTLLNLAMDVSAGSTNSLDTVVSALTKGYKGNVSALGKLNVGVDKTMIATGDLQSIVAYLSKTFSGQADTAANTYANKVLRIKTAVEDAQEAFGKGLVDSLTILTGSKSIDELQKKIIDFGTKAGEAFRTLAGFVKDNETALKNLAAILAGLFIGSKITAGIYTVIGAFKALTATMLLLRNTAIGAYIAEMAVLNPLAGLAAAAGIAATIYGVIKSLDMLSDKFVSVGKSATTMDSTAASHLATLNKEFNTTKKLVNYKKILTAEEIKALNAAKLKAAIAKAELAMGKGDDIFNLDKVQIAAALTNQAEQLGRATTASQVLAIANDVARLKVKQDILALEDAIASGDLKAIEAATAKLNADMKILGSLQQQNLKLLDIKSLLETLKPKDLINLANLEAALALLNKINLASTGKVASSGSLGSGIPSGDYIAPVDKKVALAASTDALLEYAAAATERANAFALLQEQQNTYDQLALDEYIKKLGLSSSVSTADMSSVVPVATAAATQSGNRYAAQAAAQYNITVNTGIGDPNAIAEAINQYIVDAVDRGTLRSGTY
jgi:hypothetical protein